MNTTDANFIDTDRQPVIPNNEDHKLSVKEHIGYGKLDFKKIEIKLFQTHEQAKRTPIKGKELFAEFKKFGKKGLNVNFLNHFAENPELIPENLKGQMNIICPKTICQNGNPDDDLFFSFYCEDGMFETDVNSMNTVFSSNDYIAYFEVIE